MDYYTLFLYFIVFVKVLYSLSVAFQLTKLLKLKIVPDYIYEYNENDQKRLEHLYTFLMSTVLIGIFRKRTNFSYKFSKLEVDLLFIFGIILISELMTNWYQSYIDVDDDTKKDAVETTAEFIIPKY